MYNSTAQLSETLLGELFRDNNITSFRKSGSPTCTGSGKCNCNTCRKKCNCYACRTNQLQGEVTDVKPDAAAIVMDNAPQIKSAISLGIIPGDILKRFITGELYDENKITNEIFYSYFPALKGKKLSKVNIAEWVRIKAKVVRPLFGNISSWEIGIGMPPGRVIDMTKDVPEKIVKGFYNGHPYFAKDLKLSPRNMKSIDSIVLHQMAFDRGNDLAKYNQVGAHFIVMHNGSIGQLYDYSDYLNASNGFNGRSIAIEFAGNFPDPDFKWWPGNKSRSLLTPAQAYAGRSLIYKIVSEIDTIKYIYGHCQSSNTRPVDPGPDIWLNVAEWGIDTYGLTDKLPKPSTGSGIPIPRSWRIPRA